MCVLNENSDSGVFGGGCHGVSSLTTSLAFHAAGILSVFLVYFLSVRKEGFGKQGIVAGFSAMMYSDSGVLGPSPR